MSWQKNREKLGLYSEIYQDLKENTNDYYGFSQLRTNVERDGYDEYEIDLLCILLSTIIHKIMIMKPNCMWLRGQVMGPWNMMVEVNTVHYYCRLSLMDKNRFVTNWPGITSSQLMELVAGDVVESELVDPKNFVVTI